MWSCLYCNFLALWSSWFFAYDFLEASLWASVVLGLGDVSDLADESNSDSDSCLFDTLSMFTFSGSSLGALTVFIENVNYYLSVRYPNISPYEIFWNENEVLGPKFHLVPGMPFMKYLAQDFDLMPFITVAENVGKYLSFMKINI